MSSVPLKYLNQYITTTLSVVGGIDASQTTGIVIQSSTGLETTKAGVALFSYTDPLNTTNAEWITYTAITANELQGVVRGAEGGSGKVHANGVTIAFPLSESHINNLNAMFDTTGLDIAQIATPANPDSGRNKIYFKSDGAVYKLNSSGVETSIEGSSWTATGETFTYASADAPSYVITIASGGASRYSPGMRIKLTDSTVKYFIITAVSDTTITVYGGTDYTLSGGAISNPYFSTHKAPLGFPLNPAKWTVVVTDTSSRDQANPTQNVWYNISPLSISIPIGDWNVYYKAMIEVYKTPAATYISVYSTLSTANNSESNPNMTLCVRVSETADTGRNQTSSASDSVSLASKTTHYLNIKTNQASVGNIGVVGTQAKTVIKATCAYL